MSQMRPGFSVVKKMSCHGDNNHSSLLALPNEMIFECFSKMGARELGALSLTCRRLRLMAEHFVTLTNAKTLISVPMKKLSDLLLAASPSETMDEERALHLLLEAIKELHPLAILCKRLTLLQSSNKRLQYALTIFEECLELEPSQPNYPDWRRTAMIFALCRLMHVFVRGWDESEIDQLVALLSEKFCLISRLEDFFNEQDRQQMCVTTEGELRLALRCIVWDTAGEDYAQRAYLLVKIMNRFAFENPSRQALLLQLLFGATCGEIQHFEDNGGPNGLALSVLRALRAHCEWETTLSDVPETFAEGKATFLPLAQALSCVVPVRNAECRKWRNEHLHKVLTKTFVEPDIWKRENIAGFLLFCSEKLVLFYLRNKLIEGSDAELGEVGRLLFDMIVMSYHFGNPFCNDTGIGKIMHSLLRHAGGGERREKVLYGISEAMRREFEDSELDVDQDVLFRIFSDVFIVTAKARYHFIDQSVAAE